jgi:hypothetical protein
MIPYELILEIVRDNHRFKEISKYFRDFGSNLWLKQFGNLPISAREFERYKKNHNPQQYSIFVNLAEFKFKVYKSSSLSYDSDYFEYNRYSMSHHHKKEQHPILDNLDFFCDYNTTINIYKLRSLPKPKLQEIPLLGDSETHIAFNQIKRVTYLFNSLDFKDVYQYNLELDDIITRIIMDIDRSDQLNNLTNLQDKLLKLFES